MANRTRVALVAAAVVFATWGSTAAGSVIAAPEAAACEKHEKAAEHACSPGKPSSPSPTTPPPTPKTITIAGMLTDLNEIGGGTASITVEARETGGVVTGTASEGAAPAGPVREIVPPGEGRDYYCVNYVLGNQPEFRRNLYIRDVGDGLLTHDQFIIGVNSTDITCATPAGSFVTSEVGDIVVTTQ